MNITIRKLNIENIFKKVKENIKQKIWVINMPHTHTHAHAHTHTHTHRYIYKTYIYIYIYVYIYIYIYKYIYIIYNIYIYIYILWLHIYYAHLASARFEHSVCRRSLKTTYIYLPIRAPTSVIQLDSCINYLPDF